jgi:serine/threonine-protein kinase
MVEGAARAELPARIGRYPVLGYLADGGMAEIFLGKDPDGGAIVIKRILPHLARQSTFVAMFVDEARISSLVRHPNVVAVRELGQVGNDLFLVMEYLAGESVSGLLRRLTMRSERLPLALGAYIIAEACAGLHAAHQLRDDGGRMLGLVHRDVSLSNVFVTYAGEIKVLDFGIATVTHRLSRTATGQVKGKFSYMSPEQCRGEILDLRSDLFSLGIVLYELTTQRRLFKRANELMVARAITEDPVPPPHMEVADYPAALERVCLRALSRDKADRYASALEMRTELLAAIASLPGGNDPRAGLASDMQRLFAERIEEKRLMLQHVRLGTDLFGKVPAGEVDETIEMPQIAERTLLLTRRTKPAPQARRWLLWVAMPGGLAIILGIVLALTHGSGDRAPVAPAARPASAPPASAPAIALHIDSTPRGAAVYLDDQLAGTTPFELTLRAPRTIALRVEAAGYAPFSQQLAIDHEQHVLIPLAPAAARAPAATPPARHHASRPNDPFQRFD